MGMSRGALPNTFDAEVNTPSNTATGLLEQLEAELQSGFRQI
jgi:hypothetical protein